MHLGASRSKYNKYCVYRVDIHYKGYLQKKFIKILYGLLITSCCCIRLEIKKKQQGKVKMKFN